MAIIVEDGLGRPDAVSYATVTQADAYHAARNNTAWAGLTEGAKEAALIKATDYLVQSYRTRWIGVRARLEQSLDWPRIEADRESSAQGPRYYLENEVPLEVANATIELALRASSGELVADYTQPVKSETVGPIRVEYDTAFRPLTTFPVIERMLAHLVKGGSHQIRVLR
jgi:hypothetical protein